MHDTVLLASRGPIALKLQRLLRVMLLHTYFVIATPD
jgi:hypothetical protein